MTLGSHAWGDDYKHLDQFFKTVKGAESTGKLCLCNDVFLVAIALFFQTQTMHAITDKRRQDALGSLRMANSSKWIAAVAADANLVHKAPAHTSSEILIEDIYQGRKLQWAIDRSCIRTCRSRTTSQENSTLQSKWVTTTQVKKDCCNCFIECLNLSALESDHSSQWAPYKTYKKKRAPEAIRPINDRYNEAMMFWKYRLRISGVSKTTN